MLIFFKNNDGNLRNSKVKRPIGKGVISFFVAILILVFTEQLTAQDGALLGGEAGHGPINLADGVECKDCQYVNNFVFGSWNADARLKGAHKGLQELQIDVTFSIDNLTGFSGKNVQGGMSNYSTKEFDFPRRSDNTYTFQVEFEIVGPESKKNYNKTSEIKVRISPSDQSGTPTKVTKQVRWTFGPGELLDRLYGFDSEGTSMSEIRDEFKLKVDSWKLVSVYYPYLERYDTELGKLLEERQDKVNHDQLVRQAHEAQRNKNYKKARDLFEEALGYQESEEARGKYNQLKEYIEKTVNNSNFSDSQPTDDNSGRDQDELANNTDEESTTSSGLGDDSENTSVSSSAGNIGQKNATPNTREATRRKAIDEHNAKILQRAQTITDQAEKMMWGDQENNQFSRLEGEIGTYNRMIGALEQRRMDNLSPKERQELETYLLSMNAAQVLATLAGGGNLLDSEASLEGAVEAGVNLLEAHAERKAAEREAERKRKEAIRKMEKEREKRKRELQRKKEQEALNRMQYFSNNVLNPFDEKVIGQPVAPTAKKAKTYYGLSHKSLQGGNLNSGTRHMERALDELENKKTPEAGIIQYQLAWMYSEDDDLITAAEYADKAPELTEDTPAEDIVEEFSNGIDGAYEKQERQDFLAQKRTGTPEKLEDYLDKYPQGEYKDEAENLIKEWRMERQKKMQSLRSSYQYHEEKAAKHGRNAGISIASGIGIPLIGLFVFSEEDENGDLQAPGWVGVGGLSLMLTGGIATIINVGKQGEHNQKALNIEQQMRELRKQKFSANVQFDTKHDAPLLGFRVNF